MEMHQIKYFLAVAKTLNFTRAADQCNVTQPSLTRAIQKLEDEFGGQLFNRERALTHLTELGRMVLPHLEQTYEAAEAATSLASSIGRAEVAPLVIGVANGIATPVLDGILRSLTAALPGLSIDLRSGSSDDLVALALKGGLDLMLIARPPDTHDRLEIWPAFARSYQIAVGTGHPLDQGEPLSLAEAVTEPWIDCSDDGTQLLRTLAAKAGLDPEFRHRVDRPSQALQLVAAQLGLAILPCGTQADGICLIALADHPLEQDVVLGAVAGRRRGRAADAFLRAARGCDWKTGARGQPLAVSA
jgi:DNA-binding transcriptional LysR family regulator